MPGLVDFLRCVGRAAVKNGGKALASLVPFGDVAFDIARDACVDYRLTPGGQPVEIETVTISSPRNTYTRGDLLAKGDVADVHIAHAGETYLLKTSRTSEGDALVHAEHKVLAGLLDRAAGTTYRRYLPELAESFVPSDGGRRVNVFRHEAGWYTLEQVHARHPALDGRHLAWIFKRLLTVLGFVHAQGTVHGAVLPAHVLLHAAEHGLRLVGWGQSALAGRPVPVLSPGYRDWYPPEVLKKQAALPGTDLFLAARCLIYLAGGDPVRDRMPDAVPAPLRRFVRACLLEGVRMRPGEAWKLQDELDDLLLGLYGSPKFLDLDMT